MVVYFLGHVFKGSYTRVWHHLLAIPGIGVKACTCSLDQRMEMTKLHMKGKENNSCNIDSSSSSPSKRARHQDKSPSNHDSSINEEIESVGGGSTTKGKSDVNESILKMYNVVHRDEADDAISDFLWQMEFHLMLPVHHNIKQW